MKLAELEAALYDLLRGALATFGKAHRGEHFYAVALHGISGETGRFLSLPLLAASTTEKGPTFEASFWGAHWNPADWPYEEIEVPSARALKLEKALSALATGTDAHWRRVDAAYGNALVRIAKRLAADPPLVTTDDFVCFVHSEGGGAALAGKSMTKAQRERCFAADLSKQTEIRRVKAQPASTRADFLVTRFDQFEGVDCETAEEELVAMGEAAIPALLRVLPDKDGGTAARILGRIGDARPEVLAALRARGTELWFAKALGMLGHPASIEGFLAPLLAISETKRALDYRPLEAFLDANRAERKRAEVDLAPGRSYVDIKAADVPEAIRGLVSKHAVVRWHAAAVLGDRNLRAKTIDAALQAAQGDKHEHVRRLAGLSSERRKR